DFRDQDIGRGVYTLRYAQQPVDGNHVGTSKTRDFLLLVSAEEDRAAEPLDLEKMIAASKEAAESSHPAMLALQAIAGDVGKTPAIRENADREWQILRLGGTATADGKASALAFDLVVSGHADE
ncbi:MAG: hypothetical protein KDA41_16720, partial [Planctomycetales bacterium]|nr:hypothetical protein [Planctomycetales bacterium]